MGCNPCPQFSDSKGLGNVVIPADAKASLMELTPATYIGKAVELARRC